MINQEDTAIDHTMLTSPKPSASSKKPRRRNQSHGFSGLLRNRSKEIDGRSSLGQALAQYRADLLRSLGGSENLSTQELSLVELCGRDWIILQQIDNYLLTVGCFNRKKRQAYPLLASRSTISDSLTRKLQALGLSRRAKPVQSLAALLNGSTNTQPEEGES